MKNEHLNTSREPNDHDDPFVPELKGSRVRAWWRAARLLAGSSWLLLAHWAQLPFARGHAARLALAKRSTHRWAAYCLKTFGWRLHTEGPEPPHGSLLAPNHQSYLDILALGSAAPTFFVSKSEVSGWPFVGQLLRTSMQVFVRRQTPRSLVEAGQGIEERLRAGHSTSVFLEGTSSSGEQVLPFHASLAEPALRTGAPLVPVLIRYVPDQPEVNVVEEVAYWKNHVFGPHAMHLLGLKGGEVRVTFCVPIDPEGYDRKTLAQKAWEELDEEFRNKGE